MKQEALKYFTDLHLTVLGLLIFFGFFIAVVFWVYRKDSKALYAALTNLPLSDERIVSEQPPKNAQPQTSGGNYER